MIYTAWHFTRYLDMVIEDIVELLKNMQVHLLVLNRK